MNWTLPALAAASAVEQRLPQPTSRPLNRTLLASVAASAVGHHRRGRALQSSGGTFSCSSSIASTVSGSWKFNGAATAGNGVVVFAPAGADCVGLWDPTTQTFSCPSIAWTGRTDRKFAGAATAGNGVVVFAPYFADCVGQ